MELVVDAVVWIAVVAVVWMAVVGVVVIVDAIEVLVVGNGVVVVATVTVGVEAAVDTVGWIQPPTMLMSAQFMNSSWGPIPRPLCPFSEPFLYKNNIHFLSRKNLPALNQIRYIGNFHL